MERATTLLVGVAVLVATGAMLCRGALATRVAALRENLSVGVGSAFAVVGRYPYDEKESNA